MEIWTGKMKLEKGLNTYPGREVRKQRRGNIEGQTYIGKPIAL